MSDAPRVIWAYGPAGRRSYGTFWLEAPDNEAEVYYHHSTVDALKKALEECRDELDAYSRQEYPSDHPVHERYRQRDFDANPARIALAKIAKET